MQHEFHEVANLFPMMDSEAFQSLKKDIEENGLIEPIWLHDGKIIDGRNRYKACSELGVEPIFRHWDETGNLVGFVISLNLHRRHLTPSQYAMVGHDMLPMLEAEAKDRQRLAGGDRKSDEYQKSVMPNLAEPISPKERSIDVAAKLVGASATNIQEAKRIARLAPEKAQEIREGKKTINAASQELKREGLILGKNPSAITDTSTAWQFKALAISHLSRIELDDPKALDAFNAVSDYIQERKKLIKGGNGKNG